MKDAGKPPLILPVWWMDDDIDEESRACSDAGCEVSMTFGNYKLCTLIEPGK